MASPCGMGSVRRAGSLAALAAAPLGLAYRFALAYRVRAGYPRRDPARVMPAARGLPFEETTVRSAGLDLPAWFIPARGGAPGPGVVLVHGWESARDRTLPIAAVPPRRRVPLPDLRRPRPRRQPGREAADQRGRVRGGRARPPSPTLLDRPEVTVGGDRRPLDGRDRGDPRRGRGPARRPCCRHVRAGRPVPPDPPDLPARAPADPRPDRLSPRLADDRGSTCDRAATGSRRSAPPRRSPATAARSCSPTARTTPSSRSRHLARLAAAARAGRAVAAGRRPRRPDRDPPRRGRPALVAVRVPGVPARGRVVPGARRSAGRCARGGRRGGRGRAGRADPGRRAALQPDRGQPGRLPDPGPGRAARGDEADRPPGAGRRRRRRRRDADRRRRSRLGRDRDAAGDPRASPTARWSPRTSTGSSTPGAGPAPRRTSSAGRSSSAATGTA